MGGMADPRAGTLAQPSDLVDVAHLVTAYYTLEPDPDDVDQQVVFGTSGHRGSSLNTAFNEVHIAATTQAICDYRTDQGYDGPLFLGRDTHGLSEPAWATAIEVLVANDVTVLVDDRDGYTPTPVDSAPIRSAGARAGADARGGARVAYWGEIADRHGLELTVVNPLVDPTWRFMTLDWDGKIRMDCSSPNAMASLIGRKDEYQIAT